MPAHPGIIRLILDDQRGNNAVFQLDLPRDVSDFAPVLPVAAIQHSNNDQQIQVRFIVEVAARFRAEQHHAQQIVAVPLAQPLDKGRQPGALVRLQIRLLFAL